VGSAPGAGELSATSCARLSASLRLRACSSLWVGVGFAAVWQPEQPICVALAITMIAKVKKTDQLRLARTRSGKRDFMRRNRECARISFLFKTLASVSHPGKRCALIPVQDPQYKEHAAEANRKKDDSPLVMKFSGQIRRIYTRPKHRNRKNAKTILGHGNRNGQSDCQPFSPRRAQQELRQNHGCYQQHGARTDAAALLGDLHGQAWNVEQDAFLSDWHAGNGEHVMRCKR